MPKALSNNWKRKKGKKKEKLQLKAEFNEKGTKPLWNTSRDELRGFQGVFIKIEKDVLNPFLCAESDSFSPS